VELKPKQAGPASLEDDAPPGTAGVGYNPHGGGSVDGHAGCQRDRPSGRRCERREPLDRVSTICHESSAYIESPRSGSLVARGKD